MEDGKIRVNLLVDQDLNPKLFRKLNNTNKRKRAAIIKKILEETLEVENIKEK